MPEVCLYAVKPQHMQSCYKNTIFDLNVAKHLYTYEFF